MRRFSTLIGGLLSLCFLLAAQESVDSPPAGVEQLLPLRKIPAVFEPLFVPAGQARITPDAWILGVVIDGSTGAYSLSLAGEIRATRRDTNLDIRLPFFAGSSAACPDY